MHYVALRKESVDRNLPVLVLPLVPWWSLSARRAWIEIWAWGLHGPASGVALRKESVDRNKGPEELAQFWSSSLSARRAWIEI